MPTVTAKSSPPIYQFESLANPRLKQKSVYSDRIKIELWFETAYATHVASRVIQASAAYEGPFIESICVFMQPARVFDMVEAYWDTFEELKDARLVPQDAVLQGFDILMEDQLIQAWTID